MLHIQSIHVCACLPVIISLGAVIEIFWVPYLEFLTYTHGNRRRKIIEYQLRGVCGIPRETVQSIVMTWRSLKKRSVICWQNPLLLVVCDKHCNVWVGRLDICAPPLGLVLWVCKLAIHIPGGVDQLEGNHVTSFWNRNNSVWTVTGAKTNGRCIYLYPVNCKKWNNKIIIDNCISFWSR